MWHSLSVCDMTHSRVTWRIRTCHDPLQCDTHPPRPPLPFSEDKSISESRPPSPPSPPASLRWAGDAAGVEGVVGVMLNRFAIMAPVRVVYIFIYTFIHMYLYKCTHIYVYIHIYVYVDLKGVSWSHVEKIVHYGSCVCCLYINIHMRIYICTYMCIYTYTCIYIYKHVYLCCCWGGSWGHIE